MLQHHVRPDAGASALQRVAVRIVAEPRQRVGCDVVADFLQGWVPRRSSENPL